tara:strand:+ start:3379 stop:4629 length:1251 start_codon:yes stop_codon:yes gene_type:complete
MKKNIVIIGGGIIGCITAIYLKRKNHEVSIFEKSDKLGGILSDYELDDQIFLKGVQAFGSKEQLTKDLIKFSKCSFKKSNYDMASFTNLDSNKISAENFSLPVFKLKNFKEQDLYKKKLIVNSLKDHIGIYPVNVTNCLKKFLRNIDFSSSHLDKQTSGPLGISRVNILNQDNLLKKLKEKNTQIDKYYAINWNQISTLVKQFSVPSLGYNHMFENLENEMRKLGIKIYKKTIVFPEWKNKKLLLFKYNQKIKNDYIFWTGNPVNLVKKYNDVELDSFAFKAIQINSDLTKSINQTKYIQVYSSKSKIYRIHLYKIKNVSKIGIETFFNKDSIEKILIDCRKILKTFNIDVVYDLKTANKKLLTRFDIISIKDKVAIEDFIQKTNNTNLISSPWTTYGRDQKLIAINECLKLKNLL